MAHQAHILPWNTLADHFTFKYSNPKDHGSTNLYPTFKPGQGKQLQHFARVLASTLTNFSTEERKKYPDELIPPAEEELFIPDSTVRRIAKTVVAYKEVDGQRVPSPTRDRTLKDEERSLPYWLDSVSEIRRQEHRIYPMYHSACRDCSELLKTLVLYNEMEPLLRLATHPSIDLRILWSFPPSYSEYGIADISTRALTAYLCLNMFLVKPDLWDPISRAAKLADRWKGHAPPYPEEMHDYRYTSAYQSMLAICTWTPALYDFHDVCAHPHRDFFGIARHMITTPVWRLPGRNPTDRSRMRTGTFPPSSLLDPEHSSRYVPTSSDVLAVRDFLKSKLPTELALLVMAFADYTPRRRVPVPNDPLHKDNAEELRKYISYCWKLLVRVDMLLKANGMWVDWEYEATETMFDLWGVRHPKMSTTEDSDEYQGRQEGEVEWHRVRRTFI